MIRPKKLVGYCRVSTDNQKEEGTIEIQEKSLKGYVEKNNYELVKAFNVVIKYKKERGLMKCISNVKRISK